MKLHSSQIEMLGHGVVKKIAEDGRAEVENPDEVGVRLMRLITEDLQVEDKLNDEVRQLLGLHEIEMRDKGIQYHEMFKIVKQKLVRERKLIL